MPARRPVPTAARWMVALFGVALVSLGGCGGAKTAKREKPEPPIPLAAVDPDSAITVDGGRISVVSPAGWTRAPRSNDCLVRYLPGPQKTFPSVVVLGEDPPAGITAVDAESHAAFVEAVAGRLAETFTSPEGKSTLLRKPAPLKLGPHAAVIWAAPGRATVDGIKQAIERSCAAIVVDGRMYTVEARAPKGKLDDTGRGAARAVAAAITVPAPAEPEPEPEAPATPDEPKEPAPTAEPAAPEEPATPVDPVPAEGAAAPADAPAEQ